jgi:hypothetical protein
MRALVSMVVFVVLASPAFADDSLDFEDMITRLPGDPASPRFTISNERAGAAGAPGHEGQPSFGGMEVKLSNLVVARSADGSAAWVAADAKGVISPHECMPGPCRHKNKAPPLHATGVAEQVGKQWKWVAWHITDPVSAKEQADLIKQNVLPDVLPRAVTGAEEAVKVFESSIGDPKAFAATVSDRKDVVLYGSEQRERTVGGAKVKARLTTWKLAFKVRDGVQAGLAGKSVAWVAANVDATGPKTKATPYRVLALYEKSGTAWKLVQAHFSVDRETYVPSK